MSLSWSKILTVFISSALKPVVGIPAAVELGFGFWEAFIVCSLAGIFGTITFSFLIEGILKMYQKFVQRNFPNRKNRKFSWGNRLIIKIKKTFGLVGIAFIAPPLLSVPLGVFLCIRFFNDRPKVITWMSISVTFWAAVLYFLYYPISNFIFSIFN